MFILHELSQMGDRKERENLFATVNGRGESRKKLSDIKLAEIGKAKQVEFLAREVEDKGRTSEDELTSSEGSPAEDPSKHCCNEPSTSNQLLWRSRAMSCVNGASDIFIEDEGHQKRRDDGVILLLRHSNRTTDLKRPEQKDKVNFENRMQFIRKVAVQDSKENGIRKGRRNSLTSSVDLQLNRLTDISLGESTCKRNPYIEKPIKLILNVGGTLYETFEKTLSAHPDTLLGDPERRLRYYNPVIDQYVFERHVISFDAILFYYQSKGILSKPQYIDQRAFEEDLEFFEITSKRRPRRRFINRRSQKISRPDSFRRTPKRVLHNIFNRPFSSSLACAVSLLTIIVTMIATVVFCIETLPCFRLTHGTAHLTAKAGTTQNKGHRILVLIEIGCMAFITSDFLIRFSIARNRFRFIISHLGAIDLMTLLPFYLSLVLSNSSNPKQLRDFVTFLRQLRILQVFRLARYSYGFRALLHTVSKSLSQLGSFIFVMPVMSMFFASVSYFAEDNFDDGCVDSCRNLQGISDWFWYSVITITTVGYGDVYPRTILGKLVGAICALFGVILFCLLTPIIFRHFVENYYVRELMSQNITAEKRKLAEKVREMYYEQYDMP